MSRCREIGSLLSALSSAFDRPHGQLGVRTLLVRDSIKSSSQDSRMRKRGARVRLGWVGLASCKVKSFEDGHGHGLAHLGPVAVEVCDSLVV